MPAHWCERKIDSIAAIVEAREFKRMWRDTELNIDQAEFRVDLARRWLESYVLVALEEATRKQPEILPMKALLKQREYQVQQISRHLNEDPVTLARRVAEQDAVPFIASLRYTEVGLGRHDEWLAVWEAQRAEDRGLSVEAEAAPRYEQEHFLAASFWRLRGKLDVPKERFISYPGCESDNDGEPVYGWAGWDHLQRAKALASLYLNRKDVEGWTAERLTPMLAGLLELIPWVKQWHNEPSEELAGYAWATTTSSFSTASVGYMG
jgi:hypothetical protein